MNFKKIFLYKILIIGALNFLNITIFGSSYENYRERINSASEKISIITTKLDPESLECNSQNTKWNPKNHLTSDQISQLKLLLPKTETVELANQNILVNNYTIYELLQNQEASTNCSESIKILDEIDEYLYNLSVSLSTSNTTTVTLHADIKNKIDKILSRKDFRFTKEDSWRQRLLQWIKENILTKIQKYLPRFGLSTSTSSSGMKWTLLSVLGLVVLGLIYSLYARLRYTQFSHQIVPHVILGEKIDTVINVETFIDTAIQLAEKGEYRQAIRKIYIALLYEMDKRKFIFIEPYKTNREYLNSVRTQLTLYPLLLELTDNFDRYWYGKVQSAQYDYDTFFSKYNEALSSLIRK